MHSLFVFLAPGCSREPTGLAAVHSAGAGLSRGLGGIDGELGRASEHAHALLSAAQTTLTDAPARLRDGGIRRHDALSGKRAWWARLCSREAWGRSRLSSPFEALDLGPVGGVDTAGHRAWRARADAHAVDLDHRHDQPDGAGEEQLVGRVDVVDVQQASRARRCRSWAAHPSTRSRVMPGKMPSDSGGVYRRRRAPGRPSWWRPRAALRARRAAARRRSRRAAPAPIASRLLR